MTAKWLWCVNSDNEEYYLVSSGNQSFLTRSKSKATIFNDRNVAVAKLSEFFKLSEKYGIQWPFNSNFKLASINTQ